MIFRKNKNQIDITFIKMMIYRGHKYMNTVDNSNPIEKWFRMWKSRKWWI